MPAGPRTARGRRLRPRTAAACERASRSPRVRATMRSGCGIAVMTPKSGQVPTTTTAPLARSRRTATPSRRADGPMPLTRGDVVGADHDHRGVRRRARDEHGVDLTGQPLRRGADDRLGAQPNPLARLLGQAARDQHAGHLVGDDAAVAGGGRVAEDHQVQVERHAAVPLLDRAAAGRVDAVGARRDVPRLGDDLAGLVGLPAQQVAGADVRRSPSMRPPPQLARAMVDRRGARMHHAPSLGAESADLPRGDWAIGGHGAVSSPVRIQIL